MLKISSKLYKRSPQTEAPNAGGGG